MLAPFALYCHPNRYLVHRVVPMLPSILCEELCSLNPSVERLAFSVVWRMHRDGSLVRGAPVWFGRSVIRSCAKLDYGTAQRMIDGTIPELMGRHHNPNGGGGDDSDDDDDDGSGVTEKACYAAAVPEEHWETARRPTGGHSLAGVVADVKLMHSVAMARRRRRFRTSADPTDNATASNATASNATATDGGSGGDRGGAGAHWRCTR